MSSNTKWKIVVSSFVCFCVVVTSLEPSAFARNRNDDARNAVSLVARLQTPPATPAVKVANPADTRPQPAHKSGKRKWFVILAVAAGAIVAVVLTQHKKTTPSITVGAPTIG